ncbi:MAG: alpha/beta fold hydrolase, partial [Spirochaetota bacterium]
LARGSFTREQLGRPWETHRIRSSHGYDLVVHVLPGTRLRIALFHHGVRWNWMGSIKYAEAFVREGWTVIAFDARGHGETRGPRPSFGHFERDDLLSIADWALARWPADRGFVVHGESLGGASALQYAPLDPRIDAVIADCPFSSAREILETRLRALHVPRRAIAPVVHLAAILIRATELWRIDEASPRRSILETSLPILLIHGSADTYVPTAMSVSMAAERRRLLPDAITELRLVEGARHAAAFRADPAAYEATVLAFVDAALSHRRSMPTSLASTASLD